MKEGITANFINIILSKIRWRELGCRFWTSWRVEI